ncbi:MAG: protein kinase domain-containing protein [bacterium]
MNDDSQEHDDALYDEFLAAVAAGDDVTVEQFLRARGGTNAELARTLEEVARRLRGVHAGPILAASAGSQLGEFRLIDRIGTGGMGVVYLAEQTSLGRNVALKVMRPEIAESDAARRRFLREARAAAALCHPSIVAVHSVGEDGGVRYIAMELVPGQSLDALLKERERRGENVATKRVLSWGMELASALAYAHAQGIVHRDIKPSNVRITTEDHALLLDFGLARELGSDDATLTHSFVGTPRYAAPEQLLRGRGDVGPVSDVYSLGVLLYRAFSGRAPFEGQTLEQLVHEMAVGDAPRLRALRPDLPRDVETVVLHAIEKDPARRYASATALGADLSALLELRPIAARPQSVFERLRVIARRHPAMSAAICVAGLALVGLGGLIVSQSRAEQRTRREAIETAMSSASRSIERLTDDFSTTSALEVEIRALWAERVWRYFTAEEDARIQTKEGEVARLKLGRERTYHEALQSLSEAARLGADSERVATARARLNLARYFEALRLRDTDQMRLYRELVATEDPSGAVLNELVGDGRVEVVSDPPGAELYLYRMRDLAELIPDAEPRVVFTPIGGDGASPFAPGTWALRVVAGAGELEPGDLIFEILDEPIRGSVFVRRTQHAGDGARLVAIDDEAVQDLYEVRRALATPAQAARRFQLRRGASTTVERGVSLESLGWEALAPSEFAAGGGMRATVWRARALQHIELPAGLETRPTARPLVKSAEAFAGVTPLESAKLESGQYVLLLCQAGYEPLVTMFRLSRGKTPRLELKLYATRTTPPGFVRIVHEPHVAATRRDYWLGEHEVTLAEYLEFLDDPATRAELAARPELVRVPSDFVREQFLNEEPGQHRLPPEWRLDWPVVGVSWHDAADYAAWRTRRARAAGLPHTYRLPDNIEWERAAGTTTAFVYGDRFRPKWMSSCFARPLPNPEPVMSFPIDESPFGVYDLAGSASEWIDHWWLADRGLRRFCGGSWGDGGPDELFSVYGANGRAPDTRVGTLGFRLALEMDSD